MTRSVARIALALFYLLAGVLHVAIPRPLLSIVPGWVPFPQTVVFWTGIAEVLGALTLAQPWSPGLRKLAGAGLAVYAVCVFPANINHFMMDMARPDGGLGLAYHVPRMFVQPVLVWLALWTGGLTNWPATARPR